MDFLQNVKSTFGLSDNSDPLAGLFKVTVVDFEESSGLNCGRKIAQLLRTKPIFDVSFISENFSKSFLNMQGRNFFDFIDKGERIFEKYHSDIIVWGYEDDGKIRINFQISKQYIVPSDDLFSLLNSLYLPLSCFGNQREFPPELWLIVYGGILAAIKPITSSQKKHRLQILQEVVAAMAKENAPDNLSAEFKPYILNLVGKIYLSSVFDFIKQKDTELIKDIFEKVIANKQYMRLPIYCGCAYENLAQLYEQSYWAGSDQKTEYLKLAIENYRSAQKLITRNYPYDYAWVSYHLAKLYFEYWKFSSDIQALRDASSQLREAEKVYSLAQFASSWFHIEGLLGYYLSLLGTNVGSNEIMLMSINAFKNQQRQYMQNEQPLEWAKIQEKIGDVLYILGKKNDDDNFMHEAKNYFNSAKEVYAELKCNEQLNAVQKNLEKIKNYVD